jgi:GntR family transcriptional regulator
MSSSRGPADLSRLGLTAVPTSAQRLVKAELVGLLERLGEQGVRQLPPEEQLSAVLEVSRPTVRTALQDLQREGKLQRLQGRGTYINRHALGLPANLAEEKDFSKLLASSGYEPAVTTLAADEIGMPEDLAEILDAPGGEPACAVRRLFTASGAPAIFVTDYVPVRLLVVPVERVADVESSFQYVRDYTARRVRYSISHILPSVASEAVASGLGVAEGDPLLLLRTAHFDEDDEPCAVSSAHINTRYLEFTVVRTYTS